MRTIVTLAGFLVSAPACSAQQSLPVVLTSCPDDTPACVAMSLDVPSDSMLDAQRNPRSEDAGGYSTFQLTLSGNLEKHPQDSITIIIRGYTAGLVCSVFGQARAAVVGYTPAREPILLTTMGRLVVRDSRLEVGCPTCGRLLARSSGDTVVVVRTPGWDLSLAGHGHLDFSYGDDGTLYLLATEHGCVALPRASDFAMADSGRCAPARQIGNGERQVPGFQLDPGEWLLDHPGARYVLLVRAGAC